MGLYKLIHTLNMDVRTVHFFYLKMSAPAFVLRAYHLATAHSGKILSAKQQLVVQSLIF